MTGVGPKCQNANQAIGVPGGLLVAESDHWIDARGAACGNYAGQRGDQQQYDGCYRKGRCVEWFHFVKEFLHEAREAPCREKTYGRADECWAQSFFQDKSENISGHRAE